ncbi:BTAD domain-containing putative transcriptional regulator [Streptomyces nigra]|uniref:AfsR/SARP family transcriptional regulator n=1 Tax=Streptomyces nigra TaxID=1827580 RepID=UPI0036937AEF
MKAVHAGVQFSVLGPVRLHRQGKEAAAGNPRRCAVPASLLLRSGSPVTLAILVEDVWGDGTPPSAIGSVRTYVCRLRQAQAGHLDSSVWLVEGGYALCVQPEALGLNSFTQTAAQARQAKAGGDLSWCISLLTQFFGMWRGCALAGVPALSNLRLACLEDPLGREVERGQFTETVPEPSALLVHHLLRERVRERPVPGGPPQWIQPAVGPQTHVPPDPRTPRLRSRRGELQLDPPGAGLRHRTRRPSLRAPRVPDPPAARNLCRRHERCTRPTPEAIGAVPERRPAITYKET